MIDPALGEKAKLRIVVRNISGLLCSGAPGFDTALATSGPLQISIIVSWSSIGSNRSVQPNSTAQSRINQIPRIISLIPALCKLKRWRDTSEMIDIETIYRQECQRWLREEAPQRSLRDVIAGSVPYWIILVALVLYGLSAPHTASIFDKLTVGWAWIAPIGGAFQLRASGAA